MTGRRAFWLPTFQSGPAGWAKWELQCCETRRDGAADEHHRQEHARKEGKLNLAFGALTVSLSPTHARPVVHGRPRPVTQIGPRELSAIPGYPFVRKDRPYERTVAECEEVVLVHGWELREVGPSSQKSKVASSTHVRSSINKYPQMYK